MALGDVVGNDSGVPATPQQPPGQTVLATHATFAEALLERDRDRSYVVVMHDYEPEGRYPIGPEPPHRRTRRRARHRRSGRTSLAAASAGGGGR